MVSRRKILSQSRDELSYVQEEEEDVWYTKDKLYKVQFIYRESSDMQYVLCMIPTSVLVLKKHSPAVLKNIITKLDGNNHLLKVTRSWLNH